MLKVILDINGLLFFHLKDVKNQNHDNQHHQQDNNPNPYSLRFYQIFGREQLYAGSFFSV
ncbi:hypothetical protein JCM15548_13895 [Geofilum rubicundum JCM 15548]|uniref:Uncharacterized protein n=1 Tax=Geofilum rubicundum JCM 15548 TaxID=1236989 RepID=A0A0E9M146_9BACT|nr:hypothetical protein JCM15548_13895 [Geofilum rubicundum JCM 15548]